jgi:uncharacterized damage-inducible protein DinB
MSLSEILKEDAAATYGVTRGLFALVDDLAWKPSTGRNWMTTGQLLRHCADACGAGMRGFITGDWGEYGEAMAEAGEAPPLPTAEELPAVASVDEALRLLEADQAVCMQALSGVSDERLLGERSVAPWGGPEQTLLQHCFMNIRHLAQHKGQLFYYLKLQGKDVNTMHLWMGPS